MAKKQKAKAVNPDRVIRDTDHPAGKVADFKPVRTGSDRAIIVELAGKNGGAHIDEIAKAIKSDRGTVKTHLHTLGRDCAIGNTIRDEKVTLKFPGGRTWRDAIKVKAKEEKKAA